MIMNNIQILCNQIPLGIAIAASTLVGGAIGECNANKAKSYLKMILTFTITLIVSLQVVV